MAINVNAQICVRRDTAANWSSANPTLLNGEVGYDTTNNKMKVGNGTLGWNALPYLTDATGSVWPDPVRKALWQCEFTSGVPTYPAPGASSTLRGLTPQYYYGANDRNYMTVEGIDSEEWSYGAVAVSVMGPNMWCWIGESIPSGYSAPSGDNNAPTARYHTQEFVSIFRTPFSTANYILCVGASNNGTGDPRHTANTGFFFKYQPGNNGNRWQCVIRLLDSTPWAQVEYVVDSGIAFSAYTVYNLKVVTTEGPGPTLIPTVRFYINEALVATVNLSTYPSTQTEYFFPLTNNISQTTQSGLGAYDTRAFYVDYMHRLITFNTVVPRLRDGITAVGSSES